MVKIGETISEEQLKKMYPVGKTISKSEFEGKYGTTTKSDAGSKKSGTKISNIAKSLASSEISYSQNVGQAAAYAFNIGGTRTNIKKAQEGYINSANKLLDMANKTTDEKQRQKLIDMANYDIDQANKVVENVLPATKKTMEQHIGDTLGTAVDVGSLGISAAPVKAAVKGGGVLKGISTGAKVGALSSAAYGTAKSTATALSENKGATETLKAGIIGGIEGGALGAVIGGVSGGISGGIQKVKAKKITRALENIVPQPKELSPKEYKSLLKKGIVKPGTKVIGAEVLPSSKEVRLATEYKDILQSKNPIKNINTALKKIESIDDSVGKRLTNNNVPYNKGELKSYLNQKIEEISDIMVPNQKALVKAKQNLVDTFVNSPATDDLKSLWVARKDFDRIIENKFKAFSGNQTLKKELMRETRNGVQEFINQKVQDGSYKVSMKTMTDLYDIVDASANKAVRAKGLSAIRQWMKSHTTMVRVAEGVGLGVLARELYGRFKK